MLASSVRFGTVFSPFYSYNLLSREWGIFIRLSKFLAGIVVSVVHSVAPHNISNRVSVFVCAEDIFGCTESSNRRFHHEQKQERKRVLQPRCWGFDVHSPEAVPEPKTHRLRSAGHRLVSASVSIYIQNIHESHFI